MRKISWKQAAFIAIALFGSSALVGCEKDDSAGGIGKKIDNTLDPRGPAQKVGDKIDNTLGK